MASIDRLLDRKAKADALPPEIRRQHLGVYLEVCEELMAHYVNAAAACDGFLQAFATSPEDMNAMTAAYKKLREDLSCK